MAEHTPGPWRAVCGDTVCLVTRYTQGKSDSCGSVRICDVGDMRDAEIRQFNKARWFSDARLIASAPNLLAAAKEALVAINKLWCAISPTAKGDDGISRFAKQDLAYQSIEAAIAKAEGKAP